MTGLAARPALTAAQLCQAQEKLGLTNLEMAHALEITGKGAAALIAVYRLGRRPLPKRASQLIRMWLAPDLPGHLRPWPAKGRR